MPNTLRCFLAVEGAPGRFLYNRLKLNSTRVDGLDDSKSYFLMFTYPKLSKTHMDFIVQHSS